MSGLLCAHARQYRFSHIGKSEEIGFEHRAYFAVLTFFDRAEIAVTGIVDQNIDAAEFICRGFDGCTNFVWLGHIKAGGQRILTAFGFQIAYLVDIARGDEHAPAALQYQLGDFAAEAGRTASDEPNRGIGLRHI